MTLACCYHGMYREELEGFWSSFKTAKGGYCSEDFVVVLKRIRMVLAIVQLHIMEIFYTINNNDVQL